MFCPSENTRVGLEELFQVLRRDSSQSPNVFPDLESIRGRAAVYGAEEPPEMGEMIKRMGIDAAS
jgi:hypothetical protein